MAAALTRYWRNDTWNQAADYSDAGDRLDHAAGNQFSSRGVERGDDIYVISVFEGNMYLLGRMQVDRICDQEEAERLMDRELWSASEHVIARDEGTPMDFERKVGEVVHLVLLLLVHSLLLYVLFRWRESTVVARHHQ